MIGLDSGDLLVMGGHEPSIGAYSNAIYRLSSNVWTHVGEFQRPTVREADPLKIGNYVFLAGSDGYAAITDNPILFLTLDQNEAVISQEQIGSFSMHQRVALIETTDGYCT